MFIDPVSVEVSGPNDPVVEGEDINISCQQTGGYPDWLQQVTWYKDDQKLDIGEKGKQNLIKRLNKIRIRNITLKKTCVTIKFSQIFKVSL